MSRAEAFLLKLYEDMKHGDEAHRAWLKERLLSFEPELAKLLPPEPYLDQDAPWA